MKFLAKFFWPLLPVLLLFVAYREANTSVNTLLSVASSPSESLETYKDIQGIATVVLTYYKDKGKLPPDVSKFLLETRKPKAGRGGAGMDEDFWGTAYQLRDHKEYFEVVSCGPDKDCATEDDNMIEPVRKSKMAPLDLEKFKKDLNKITADDVDREPIRADQ